MRLTWSTRCTTAWSSGRRHACRRVRSASKPSTRLKAPFFLTRREMGIYNVGGPGVSRAGDAVFRTRLQGGPLPRFGRPRGDLRGEDAGNPAKFYFNSLTAHPQLLPTRRSPKPTPWWPYTGSLEGSNDRNINKMLVNQVLPTCSCRDGHDRSCCPEACGTRCPHTCTRAAWRPISISKCPRTRPCVISWTKSTRRATSG